MKKIHYRNIGFPKTGTTWLYYQLNGHPDVDCKPHLTHKEYDPETKEQYIKFYEKYNVSYNLRTLIYLNPNRLYYFTHLTFILRNPYELLNSWYNYLKYNPNYTATVEEFLRPEDYNFNIITDVESIFKNWESYPVHYLFYDDLKNNNQEFFYSLCDIIGIRRHFNKHIKPKFQTMITQEISIEDENLIKYINEKISIIEDHTKRDLTHWKK